MINAGGVLLLPPGSRLYLMNSFFVYKCVYITDMIHIFI